MAKSKKVEMMRVPLVADGAYAGSRALKGFASNGLGTGYAHSRRENAIRVSRDTIPVNLFAVLEEHPDGIRRGLDAQSFATARRAALKLARALEPLDEDTLWASKTLLKTPTVRAPAPLLRDQGAADESEVKAEVFATLLREVGAGRSSLEVLRELVEVESVPHAAAAVCLVRADQPGVPDWYWHPGLTIPEAVWAQVDAIAAGKLDRVRLVDPDLEAARVALLKSAKLDPEVQPLATAQLKAHARR